MAAIKHQTPVVNRDGLGEAHGRKKGKAPPPLLILYLNGLALNERRGSGGCNGRVFFGRLPRGGRKTWHHPVADVDSPLRGTQEQGWEDGGEGEDD